MVEAKRVKDKVEGREGGREQRGKGLLTLEGSGMGVLWVELKVQGAGPDG